MPKRIVNARWWQVAFMAAALCAPGCERGGDAETQGAKAEKDDTADRVGKRRGPKRRPKGMRPKRRPKGMRPKRRGPRGERPNRRRPKGDRPGRKRRGNDEPLPAPPEGEWQEVRVRFHMMKAPGSKWLHTTTGKDHVSKLLAESNRVWAPAKIKFVLDSVVEQNALEVARHDAAADAMRGKRKNKKAKREYNQARRAALPQDKRIDKGIDVYVVGRLPKAGGVFGCKLGGVIYSERRKSEADGLNIAKVLAHELGHALGLKHTPCADDQNLMMVAKCEHRKPTNEALNAEQIATARSVAATGAPRCKPGDDRVFD